MSPFEKIPDDILSAHPWIVGGEVRSLAIQFDICDRHSLLETVEVASRNYGEVIDSDLDPVVDRIIVPEGYVFMTIEKNGKRYGFMTPVSVA